MYKKIKQFFFNQRNQPFDTMLGFFCAYAGIFGLINIYIGKAVASVSALGYKTTIIFNICLTISGIGMFFGIGLNKYNIEAFGLITVATSLLIRSILIAWLVGINTPTVINTIVLNCIFTLSCVIKLINIIKLNKAKELLVTTK